MVSFRVVVRAFVFLVTLAVVSAATTSNQAQAASNPSRSGIGPSTAGTLVRSHGATEAWIAGEAKFISGRELGVVCAATSQDWARALVLVGLPPVWEEYYGFSLIEQGEMYLSPYVCEGLRLGLEVRTRRSHELQVAWAVDVLVHESVHLGRFSFDEALVEACAREGLPLALHRLYGVEYGSAEMRRLTFAASVFRRTQGFAYQGGSCSGGKPASPLGAARS